MHTLIWHNKMAWLHSHTPQQSNHFTNQATCNIHVHTTRSSMCLLETCYMNWAVIQHIPHDTGTTNQSCLLSTCTHTHHTHIIHTDINTHTHTHTLKAGHFPRSGHHDSAILHLAWASIYTLQEQIFIPSDNVSMSPRLPIPAGRLSLEIQEE